MIVEIGATVTEPMAMAAGAATALAGAGWALWAALALKRAGNRLAPLAAPQRLVDDGPYRYGRHPLYLGVVLMLAGLAVALAAPVVGALAVVFAASAQLLWIPAEEAQLRARFGGWYSDYMQDVRAWL